MNLNKIPSSSSSILPFHPITHLSCKTNVTIPSFPRRFTFLYHRHHAPNIKVVRNSMQEKEAKFLEAEEAELRLATCITRTLPPALTLESGLEKIKDAVEELKSKRSCAKAGMYRFQIANEEETGVYLNFLNFLINDSVFLLDESLNKTLELKELEVEMSNTADCEQIPAQESQRKLNFSILNKIKIGC